MKKVFRITSFLLFFLLVGLVGGLERMTTDYLDYYVSTALTTVSMILSMVLAN